MNEPQFWYVRQTFKAAINESERLGEVKQKSKHLALTHYNTLYIQTRNRVKGPNVEDVRSLIGFTT